MLTSSASAGKEKPPFLGAQTRVVCKPLTACEYFDRGCMWVGRFMAIAHVCMTDSDHKCDSAHEEPASALCGGIQPGMGGSVALVKLSLTV